MESRKIIITVAAILVGLIVLVSVRNMARGFPQITSTKDQQVQVKSGTGTFQEATLKAEGYKYVITPQPLKAGVPVRMTVDLSTVNGCLRSIVIPAFGVSQNVYPGSNVIEFTPTQSGTFNIMCSMNMGRGTFTVADDKGVVSGLAEAALDTVPAGSCGGSGGGCGCGANGGTCGCGG